MLLIRITAWPLAGAAAASLAMMLVARPLMPVPEWFADLATIAAGTLGLLAGGVAAARRPFVRGAIRPIDGPTVKARYGGIEVSEGRPHLPERLGDVPYGPPVDMLTASGDLSPDAVPEEVALS